MAWIGAANAPAGCIFCDAWSTTDDRARLVVARSEHAFLILNAYPYASGHVMVALRRHLGRLTDARVEELTDAMTLVQRALAALDAEYRPEGHNVGVNQGRAAGAGIADHLHIHVVPRWTADSNFLATIGETRVLPETLERTWERLRGRFNG
ncbi:MAG: HIT domain-containing protein [Candidatus Rokubacteria bacterium]|nr:HIT domain-containing protein [Candidatus Rokubacteria bacterium]